MNVMLASAPLPPFCTLGPDKLPSGPLPGSPESAALAAWEVLTGARVARSTGSGRMSLLGAHRAEGVQLSRDRVIWIALHAFEGAGERWSCRIARDPSMSDTALRHAIVQEMGGPAEEPDEMTTLGFWLGDVGFSFDCRGPSIEIVECGVGPNPAPALRHRKIGRAAMIAATRRLFRLTDAGIGGMCWVCTPGEQLSLL